MKKITSAILIVLLLMSFSACKKEDRPAVGTTPIVDVSEDSEIRIGFILNGDSDSDSAYIQSHIQGIEAMRQALGLSEEQLVLKTDIPVDNTEQMADAVADCVDKGCKIIFGTEQEYSGVMAHCADIYPDVIFSNALSSRNNGKNLNGYSISIYQAQYLSGIVAALKTETNLIGYVAYTGEPDSLVGVDAFAMGVEKTNPEAVIYLRSVESRCDYKLEKQAADALLDLGCDVIGQNTYTSAPQQAAQDRAVWGCGFMADMTGDAPAGHLQAAVANWGLYYTKAAKDTIEGSWKSNNFIGELTNGGVTLSPVNRNCIRGTTATVNESRKEILAGSEIFVGEIVDNDGNIVCEEGTMLTESEIEDGFDWYYRNIIVY